MALLRDPEYLYNQMKRHGMKFFQVKDAAGRTLTQMDDTERPMDLAVRDLQEFFEFNTGLFTVKIQETNFRGQGGNRQGWTYEIKIGEDTPNRSAAPVITGISSAEIEQRLADQEARMRKEFEYQQKIKILEDKLEENEQADPMAERILTVLTQIFSTPAHAPAISGDPAQPATVDEKRQRLNAAVKKLLAADPDFIQHIEQLAQLAQDKPGIYQMAVEQLKQL